MTSYIDLVLTSKTNLLGLFGLLNGLMTGKKHRSLKLLCRLVLPSFIGSLSGNGII